ncbi:PREDICTED: E3 ubiquitin-protein ligase TTC3-like [Cyprinodon variegatus]|uniref:E3 ubiquitin-protein ligase TTC3-like n=1 Tax=Cyprinodon variegatus TaxID=28743 RepID=UPI0007427941|nr:PREDICTED: E3 ubiquitin-protein ligase TTC3-like [Cyprinodon variegatus]
MRVCVFWFPSLLQPDNSRTCDWAVAVGLINSKKSGRLHLNNLHKIQVVEKILLNLEVGSWDKDFTKKIFAICNELSLCGSPDVMEETVRWLEKSVYRIEREQLLCLGDIPGCYATFTFIFSEYCKFILEMSKNLDSTMKALRSPPEEAALEKSEAMKKLGNDKFQEQQYGEALKYYTKAIKVYPDNHILYGNRALCYIKQKEYLKAAGDAKRAILIDPLWAKGHYRYCEALFYMKERDLALEAHTTAKILCKDNPEGLRDLEQQYLKFHSESVPAEQQQPYSFKAGLVKKTQQPTQTGGKTNPPKSPAAKVPVCKMEKKTEHLKVSLDQDRRSKNSKTSKSDREEPVSAGEQVTKNKSKNMSDEVQKPSQKKLDSKELCKELKFLVQEAHTALSDRRSHNAEQAFSRALDLLEGATPKSLGLSTLDVLLLLFGRVSALIEIGQPDELAEAEKLLEKMKSFEERTFQCLVYYAIGRVFLRENRFKVAMQQFLDSLQMVKNQITPGKLTWPLTKEIIKETQPDDFKEMLENAIELCKFPPAPDAICRLEKCLFPLKPEIYFTDPDFKGYIQICCCQSCRVEFHINCWKSLKTTKFCEKNEKDILHEACFTPDCLGKICSIKIFGPTGLVKCKFETMIVKPEMPKKPKMNQKATSVKKLKSKEDQKQKRKESKQTKDNQTISNEILQKKDESRTQSQQKAWLVYRDRVLLQISQNMDLLREEQGLQVSVLTGSLQPWLELDWSRGNQIAGRLLNWQQEKLETLGQALDLLLERKNRVWARVFVKLLSSCVGINSKLSNWARQLDNAGLNAAQSFIDRHLEHLEQLDLAILLNFDPLMEIILQKLDITAEFFPSLGLTVTEYLKQASAHDMRLFIWTLEEHREDYVSCHTILDEYFDMDGHCSVLKKSENEHNSPTRAKSRGRKKKRKNVIGFCPLRGVAQREEWDQDFFDDDSLSFLHPNDPFSVPRFLQEEVENFEEYYSRYLNPSKESLYDYFAQILEEHGPLAVDDHLLVGGYANFPYDVRKRIDDAGGLEFFLLESLRFIKLGRCIGLAKHAVSMQQARHGPSLDDLDEIVDSHCDSLSPDLYTASDFTDFSKGYSPIPQASHLVLPNPYSYSSSVSPWPVSDFDPSPHFLTNGFTEPHLDVLDEIYENPETNSASQRNILSQDENCSSKHASVQTCPEACRSVAVNTELYERFEKCQGDLIKQEKNNKALEEQIKITENCEKPDPSNNREIILLEKRINDNTLNIQVTNKELVMFQQKLEEEVKKDQKEKKANQEELKSLKMELEQLVEEQGSLSRNIREKRSSYEAKLNDFLELSNQSAAEKMSLEDEIKRCKALLASSTRRSHIAKLSVIESSRDQGLYGLYRELADAKALLNKLDEAAHRNSSQELEMMRDSCKAKMEEVEKNISTAQQRFQEQQDELNKDRAASQPPQAKDKPQAVTSPLSATAKEFHPLMSAQAARSASPRSAAEASATSPYKLHRPVFEKAMENLTAIFPDSSRSELMRFIQEFRSSRGGNLNSVSLQEVVSGVTQIILDHQETLKSVRTNIMGRSSPALTQHTAWQSVGAKAVKNPSALNMEDPCIICHEDMSQEDSCVLECRHTFHDECIRSWLKEKNTCPTCRNHALIPDEFPVLSSRRRKAP